jgi:hypothetical protein
MQPKQSLGPEVDRFDEDVDTAEGAASEVTLSEWMDQPSARLGHATSA